MKSKILNESSINIVEVKEILDETIKKEKQLNFRAQKTLEYLEQTASMPVDKAKKLKDALLKLNISRLKDVQVNKIIDLLPKTPNELKVILQGYNLTLTNDQIKSIIDKVIEFA